MMKTHKNCCTWPNHRMAPVWEAWKMVAKVSIGETSMKVLFWTQQGTLKLKSCLSACFWEALLLRKSWNTLASTHPWNSGCITNSSLACQARQTYLELWRLKTGTVIMLHCSEMNLWKNVQSQRCCWLEQTKSETRWLRFWERWECHEIRNRPFMSQIIQESSLKTRVHTVCLEIKIWVVTNHKYYARKVLSFQLQIWPL